MCRARASDGVNLNVSNLGDGAKDCPVLVCTYIVAGGVGRDRRQDWRQSSMLKVAGLIASRWTSWLINEDTQGRKQGPRRFVLCGR